MNWNIVKERPEVKTSELLDECKSLFPVWAWKDFKDFDRDFPAPKKATIHTFEASPEAPEKHKNKSYSDLEKEGVRGITLREYLIMEIQYFKETGKLLDEDTVTLCSGSLYADGGVPGVSRGSDGKVFVVWYRRDYAAPDLRAREVVSGTLVPSPLVPFDPSLLKFEYQGKSYKITEA